MNIEVWTSYQLNEQIEYTTMCKRYNLIITKY